jgi:hypothetical protein
VKYMTKIVSLVALGLVIIPCLLYFLGMVELTVVKSAALIGTLGWFIATPMWMSRELAVDAAEVEI